MEHKYALKDEEGQYYIMQLHDLYQEYLENNRVLSELTKAKILQLNQSMWDKSGFTILMLLAARPSTRNWLINSLFEMYFEMMPLVAQLGVDINQQDKNGCTALMFVALGCTHSDFKISGAISPKREKMTELIVNQLKADLSIQSFEGKTAYDYFRDDGYRMPPNAIDMSKIVTTLELLASKDKKQINKGIERIVSAITKKDIVELVGIVKYPMVFSQLPLDNIDEITNLFVNLPKDHPHYQIANLAMFDYLATISPSQETSKELTQEKIALLEIKLRFAWRVGKERQEDCNLLFHALCGNKGAADQNQDIRRDADTLFYLAEKIRELQKINEELRSFQARTKAEQAATYRFLRPETTPDKTPEKSEDHPNSGANTYRNMLKNT